MLVLPSIKEIWAQREEFDWEGRKIHVVSADGLAKMKKIAGRTQDLLDLEKLGLVDEQET